jgi:hypothetical protein
MATMKFETLKAILDEIASIEDQDGSVEILINEPYVIPDSEIDFDAENVISIMDGESEEFRGSVNELIQYIHEWFFMPDRAESSEAVIQFLDL